MVPSVEQVLLAQIQKENANRLTAEESAGTGAALGGIAGILGSDGNLDPVILANRMQGKSSPGRGFVLKMAGGLTGAILGGGLGLGLQQMAKQSSPAGELLAKLQTGDLSASDQHALQEVLASSYGNVIGM